MSRCFFYHVKPCHPFVSIVFNQDWLNLRQNLVSDRKKRELFKCTNAVPKRRPLMQRLEMMQEQNSQLLKKEEMEGRGIKCVHQEMSKQPLCATNAELI